MAGILKKQSRYEEAFQGLVKANEAMPDDTTLLRAAGSAAMHISRFQDAATYFEKVLKLQPDDSKAQKKLEKVKHRMEVELDD